MAKLTDDQLRQIISDGRRFLNVYGFDYWPPEYCRWLGIDCDLVHCHIGMDCKLNPTKYRVKGK